ncbi:hypothetical protein BGZ61DRAFT_121888 [Ilyonectria robusta]|uniref:uncharacterized protein n=1 Tax=Ilyonectria robusta TaxID=1079257 RepID=UPI001E8CFD97|nr:uncharacterized protein BGZ61DRAFT_121888 [Ilyonectria robusta]KAH8666240.1 hypothetical protein BGZ61DRAFT_121888 [Ilyonectria robusta]
MMDKLTTPPPSVMLPQELETSSPECHEQAPASPSLPLSTALLPIRELAGRGKVTWIWDCCQCGQAGLRVSVDPCPRCNTQRCPFCTTKRLRVRSADILEPWDESDD